MTTRIQTFGGNIGIGTDDPGSFKLNVNGDVKADSLIINGVTNSEVPIGLIQIWYGTVETIPDGWVLCNGSSHNKSDGSGTIETPNLSNRIVRGATSTPQVGQTTGANAITLSEATLPPHAHNFTSANSNAPHSHAVPGTNHNHTHELGNGGGQHGHPMGQTAAPHDHPVGGTDCTHTHTNQSNNAPHGHGQPAAENAPHAHQHTGGNPGAAGGGPRSVYATFPNQQLATGTNDAPHSHNTNNAQAPHKHNYNNSNAPHGHQSGASNANHQHSVNANSSTGHPHSIPDANAPHTHTLPTNVGTHAHTGTTASTGQETSIGIQNPFYKLIFIMKI